MNTIGPELKEILLKVVDTFSPLKEHLKNPDRLVHYNFCNKRTDEMLEQNKVKDLTQSIQALEDKLKELPETYVFPEMHKTLEVNAAKITENSGTQPNNAITQPQPQQPQAQLSESLIAKGWRDFSEHNDARFKSLRLCFWRYALLMPDGSLLHLHMNNGKQSEAYVKDLFDGYVKDLYPKEADNCRLVFKILAPLVD